MIEKLWAAALGTLVIGSLAACKGDESGTGGSGGGATTTTTSTTTTTGTDTCSSCWPACFLDMFAPCTPSGTCTKASSTTGTETTVGECYQNGVKTSVTVGATGASLASYKPDGTVCYTADSTYTATTVTAIYKDASGNVLLTDTSPLSGGAQTITCGGKTYTVDPAACMACQPGGSTPDCTAGGCVVP